MVAGHCDRLTASGAYLPPEADRNACLRQIVFLHRSFPNPISVEHSGRSRTRLVEALVGVGPEVVALGLEQVGGLGGSRRREITPRQESETP